MGVLDGGASCSGDGHLSAAAAAITNATAAATSTVVAVPQGADGSPYVAGPRPPRDVWWARALAALLAAALLGGVIAAAGADRRAFDSTFLAGPTACAGNGFAPRLLREAATATDDDESDGAAAAASVVSPGVVVLWLLLSLLAPVGLGYAWLRAWARHPERMVWASAALHVGCFAAAAAIMFGAGAAPGGAVMLAAAVIVAVLWGCSRREMALCARLLSVSANGLSAAAPGLLGVTLALWAAVGAVMLAAAGFGVAAYANGRPMPSRELFRAGRRLVFPPAGATAADLPAPGERFAAVFPDRCELDGALVVPCCEWRTSGGGALLVVALCAAAAWVAAAAGAARRFVVTSVIAQVRVVVGCGNGDGKRGRRRSNKTNA